MEKLRPDPETLGSPTRQKRQIRHIVTYQPIVSDCFGCEDTRLLCMPWSDMVVRVRHVSGGGA
jgi:hypothetical protein